MIRLKFPVNTELADKIRVNPAFRSELVQKLEQTLFEAQKGLKGGISPKEYVKVSKIVEGLQAAKAILIAI